MYKRQVPPIIVACIFWPKKGTAVPSSMAPCIVWTKKGTVPPFSENPHERSSMYYVHPPRKHETLPSHGLLAGVVKHRGVGWRRMIRRCRSLTRHLSGPTNVSSIPAAIRCLRVFFASAVTLSSNNTLFRLPSFSCGEYSHKVLISSVKDILGKKC